MSEIYQKSLQKNKSKSSVFDSYLNVFTTKVIFYDEDIESCLPFYKPSKIPACLSKANDEEIKSMDSENNVFIVNSNEFQKFAQDKTFFDNYHSNFYKYFTALIEQYFKDKENYIKTMDPAKQDFYTKLLKNINNFICSCSQETLIKNNIIEYCEKAFKLKYTKFNFDLNGNTSKEQKLRNNIKKYIMENRNKFSVRQICEKFNISLFLYYALLRESNNSENEIHTNENVKKSSIKPNEKQFIKSLLDNKHSSFSIRQITEKVNKEFQSNHSYGVIYHFITKSLGYTYKRTRLKPNICWGYGSKIGNFLIVEQLICNFNLNRFYVYIDESNFFVNQQKGFSWSARRQRAEKAGNKRGLKVHYILATSSDKIFALQLRKGPFNTASFIVFLSELAEHLKKFGDQFVCNTIFMVDQAPFHCSNFAMEFLKKQQYSTLFNLPGFSDLMPVENVHTYLKANLKKLQNHSLYCFPLRKIER